MATDAALPARTPAAPSEDEYQTFCAALTANARGRAFLAEYARRHRGADTETLLAALARLEAVMHAQARMGADQLRGELRTLIAAIRAAKPELAQAALPTRAAKLALLIDLLERRLAAIAEPAQAAAAPAEPSRLAVVPPPEEPELPIPTPTTQAPALTLTHERAPAPLPGGASSVATIPEVSWFDSAPAGPVAAELASGLTPVGESTSESMPAASERREPEVARAPTVGAPLPSTAAPQGAMEQAQPAAPLNPPSAQQPSAPPRERPAPPDPLAVLMALSEEERIALFT